MTTSTCHSPLRCLILSEVRGDTRRYRALHLVEQLRLLGAECRFVHLANPSVDAQAALGWDAAVFHRAAWGKHVQRLFEQLSGQGALILSDFDDLIFDEAAFRFIDSPDFADPIRAEMYVANMRSIHRTLEHSEGSLASTDFLARRIGEMGKPAWVHRNSFSLEMLACSEQALAAKRLDPARVVIGYASGTATHNRDFELVREALQDILRKDARVRLRLVGPLDPGPGWEGLEDRIERLPKVPWRKLPEILAGFDINLAPLVQDNPFAQSKSEIKYMESALVQSPTIAGATDAFRFAVRPGHTGLLVEHPQDWPEAIWRLVEDAPLRERLGLTAFEEVREAYHPVTRALQLADTLAQAGQQLRGAGWLPFPGPERAELQARAQSLPPLPGAYEPDPNNLQLGLYSLRTRGLSTLAKQVWIYLRRMLAPVFPFKK